MTYSLNGKKLTVSKTVEEQVDLDELLRKKKHISDKIADLSSALSEINALIAEAKKLGFEED